MSYDRRQFVHGAWLRRLARVPTPDGMMEIASLVSMSVLSVSTRYGRPFVRFQGPK